MRGLRWWMVISDVGQEPAHHRLIFMWLLLSAQHPRTSIHPLVRERDARKVVLGVNRWNPEYQHQEEGQEERLETDQ